MDKFRPLTESEIDVRVASVKVNGLSLLLYKDARCDMNILDETVGAMNWQRSHHEIKGNLHCTVSIWDIEKGIWINKSDCGAESFSEKEKGEASDSFKRACFNWGIGRELYTAPFIWIPKEKCNIEESAYNNKKTYKCYDNFYVEKIKYDDNKNIVALSIVNEKLKKRAFVLLPKDGDEK